MFLLYWAIMIVSIIAFFMACIAFASGGNSDDGAYSVFEDDSFDPYL